MFFTFFLNLRSTIVILILVFMVTLRVFSICRPSDFLILVCGACLAGLSVHVNLTNIVPSASLLSFFNSHFYIGRWHVFCIFSFLCRCNTYYENKVGNRCFPNENIETFPVTFPGNRNAKVVLYPKLDAADHLSIIH